jgi:hypothetical protein
VAPSGAAERSDGHSPRCSRTTPPAPSWPPVAGSPSAGLVPLALPDLTEIELSAPANNAA